MSAPSVWKMRLTFAFCSAKPNWIPRNPKHMFQICQNDSCGLLAMRTLLPVCVVRIVTGLPAAVLAARRQAEAAHGPAETTLHALFSGLSCRRQALDPSRPTRFMHTYSYAHTSLDRLRGTAAVE